jgi:hypothetical protein
MLSAFLFLLFVALGIASTIFWIVMLVDCATKESSQGNDKLAWILIILFAHWIGALIYFLVRRPRRIAERRAQFARRHAY